VAINQKDTELARQLEPLQQKMITLQENAKKNKKEISALKKQCSELEKERKALGQQMEKNSRELSKQLEGMCKATQASVAERYADIIDNITYLYLDSYTGY
jgi:chromosome segregation ATPase